MTETAVSTTTEQPTLRPFYETIVEMIAEMSTDDEASRLAKHLKRTEFLENHAAIAAAWIKRCDELRELRGWYIPEDYLGVPASLQKQKKASEAKVAAGKISLLRAKPLIIEGIGEEFVRVGEL